MKSICGLDCCDKCERKAQCGGCAETEGRPFGGKCVAARCIKRGGTQAFEEFKEELIDEINSLKIKDLKVKNLNLLNGFFVNLEYTLPGGQKVKLLKDSDVYLGNQTDRPNSDRCYGIAADDKYLLVCEYGCMGSDPEIVAYIRRDVKGG